MPPYKQKKPEEYFHKKAMDTGPHVAAFLEALKEHKPYCWQKMIMGVFRLAEQHSCTIADMACKRALVYGAYSYQSIKNICRKGLHLAPSEILSIKPSNGFNHDLSMYDKLSNLN